MPSNKYLKLKSAPGSKVALMPRTRAKLATTSSGARVSAPVDRSFARRANQSGSRPSTILSLLTQPKGTTVEAIIQATGWKKHSIRAFLSAVVRKKLGLTLLSEKSDGERLYRVVSMPGAGDNSSAVKREICRANPRSEKTA